MQITLRELREKEFTVQQVLGKYPEEIHPGYVIMNAPRPLYGKLCWMGDFTRGIFYAALDLNDPWWAGFAEENRKLDGWILEYIGEDVIEAYRQKLCQEHKVSPEEIPFREAFEMYTRNEDTPWRRKVKLGDYLDERGRGVASA